MSGKLHLFRTLKFPHNKKKLPYKEQWFGSKYLVRVSGTVFECWRDRGVEGGRGFRQAIVSASVWWCFVSLCCRWVPWCQPNMAAGECLCAALHIASFEECRLLSCCCSSVATIALTVFWDMTPCSLKNTGVSVETVALYYGYKSR